MSPTEEETSKKSNASDSTPTRLATCLVSVDSEAIWTVGRTLIKRGFELAYRSSCAELEELLLTEPPEAILIDLDSVSDESQLERVIPLVRRRPGRTLIAWGGTDHARAHGEERRQGFDFLLPKSIAARHIARLIETVSLGHAPRHPIIQRNLELYLTLVDALEEGSGGELVIRSGAKSGRVFLVGQRLAWTVIANSDRTLTDDLVQQVGIDRSDLQLVFKECRQTGRNFAETLISWGFVSHSDMHAVLLARTTGNLVTMFSWDEPEVLFVPQPRHYSSDLTFTLDDVLHCGHQLEHKKGSTHALCDLVEDHDKTHLESSSTRTTPLMEGRSTNA